MRIPKSANITTHLKLLHWLPVIVKSIYKVGCLCYHCHSSTAPSYITTKNPSHSSYTRSSAHTMPHLNRPAHSKATLGDRSYVFAIFMSGTLFQIVRCAPLLSSLKTCPKTYLFRTVHKYYLLCFCLSTCCLSIIQILCLVFHSNSMTFYRISLLYASFATFFSIVLYILFVYGRVFAMQLVLCVSCLVFALCIPFFDSTLLHCDFSSLIFNISKRDMWSPEK